MPGPVAECWRDAGFGPWELLSEGAVDADAARRLVADIDADDAFSSDSRFIVWTNRFGQRTAIVDLARLRVRRGDLDSPTAGTNAVSVSDGVLFVATADSTETVSTSRLLVLSLDRFIWGVVETKLVERPRVLPSAYYSLTARSGRVVWHEYVDPNGTVTRIRWRDLRTGETGEYGTTFGTGVQHPAIDGDWLVFFEYSGPWATNDVVAVNLATQERRRITETPHEKFHLAIRGTLVIWSEDTSRPDGEGLALGGDLWQHDLATGETRPLVVADELQMAPWISGDHLLWADLRDGLWRANGPPLRAEAWYLNLDRPGSPVRIGTVPHGVTMPRLVGDWLVWRDTAEDLFSIWAMPWSPPP